MYRMGMAKKAHHLCPLCVFQDMRPQSTHYGRTTRGSNRALRFRSHGSHGTWFDDLDAGGRDHRRLSTLSPSEHRDGRHAQTRHGCLSRPSPAPRVGRLISVKA